MQSFNLQEKMNVVSRKPVIWRVKVNINITFSKHQRCLLVKSCQIVDHSDQACNILFSEQTDAKLLSTRKDECGEQESCCMVR